MYQSVTEIYKPTFSRDPTKNEAGVNPSATVRFSSDDHALSPIEKSAFENQINTRLGKSPEISSLVMPKVTFNAQETFYEVQGLCTKIPTWSAQSQNPINHFVPT
jgi:hypothetical protein